MQQIGSRFSNLPAFRFWRSAPTPRMLMFVVSIISMIGGVSAVYADPSVDPPKIQNTVWFETPVAEITVGYDKVRSLSLQRTFYLAYIGPENGIVAKSGDTMPARITSRRCAETTAHAVRSQLQKALALEEARPGNTTASERIAKKFSQTNQALLTVAGTRPAEFFDCLKRRNMLNVDETSFFVALVQRNCTAKDCPLSESRRRLDDAPEALYFGDLYEWMATKVAPEKRSVTGVLLRLDWLTQPDESARIGAEVTTAKEVNPWLADESPDKATAHFIEVLNQVRDARRADFRAPKLSAYAAVGLGMSRNDLVRIADAVTDPATAYALTAGTVDHLTTVSDEIARGQLFNCRYFKGQADVVQMKACSGYVVDSTQLDACLSGGVCHPGLPQGVDITSIIQGAPMTLDQIASSNLFPRQTTATVAIIKDRYDTCAGAGHSEAAAAKCFTRATLSVDPTLQRAENCLSAVNGAAQTRCAVRAISPDADKAFGCVDGRKRTSTAATANCLIGGYLPPQNQRLLTCLTDLGSRAAIATCGSAAGGEAGKLAQCAGTNKEEIAVVACVAGDRIPGPVREAIVCVSKNASSFALAAGCIAATQVSPQLARQIGCVMESNGSPMAAGVCIATSTMNLTPEQQLALQCLASSGGQPYVFAACFGGQLTMREMIKCKGKKFGEDNCFGPNNEFQKVAHTLTGSDISANSVVGQALTVEITPATYIMEVVQPFVDNGVRSFSDSIDNAKSVFTSLANGDFGGVANAAIKEILSPVEGAKRVASDLAVSLGIKL